MQRLDDIIPQMIPIEMIDEPLAPSRRETLEEDVAELAADIREHGLQQPIGLRVIEGGRYRVVWGHRRFGAHLVIDAPTIQAKVFQCSDEEEHQMMTRENNQRVQLNPLEEARTYKREHDQFGKSWDQIAFTHKRSAQTIRDMVRMLDLPDYAQSALVAGRLKKAQALECLQAKNETMLAMMLDAAITGNSPAHFLRQWREQKERTGEDVELHTIIAEAKAKQQPEPVRGERCYYCQQITDFILLQYMWVCNKCEPELLQMWRMYQAQEPNTEGGHTH